MWRLEGGFEKWRINKNWEIMHFSINPYVTHAAGNYCLPLPFGFFPIFF